MKVPIAPTVIILERHVVVIGVEFIVALNYKMSFVLPTAFMDSEAQLQVLFNVV